MEVDEATIVTASTKRGASEDPQDAAKRLRTDDADAMRAYHTLPYSAGRAARQSHPVANRAASVLICATSSHRGLAARPPRDVGIASSLLLHPLIARFLDAQLRQMRRHRG